MNKKLLWSQLISIYLLATLSLLSACSDAEENVSTNKTETAPVIEKQAATIEQPKEIMLQDVTGLYKELPSAQATRTGDKIEVLEIFWYGCPHCYDFEPVIEEWLKEKAEYIEFIRVPGVLGPKWLPHAKAYYVAEELGIIDKIHGPLFKAIHQEKRAIMNPAELRDFFANYGVNPDDFEKTYDSKEVEQKVRDAFTAGKNYQLTGVPAVVINGKYTTSASMAGGYNKIIDVINTLAAKEQATLSK